MISVKLPLRIVFLLLLPLTILNAWDLLCLRKSTTNVDTGQVYDFTLKEAKSNPFYITEISRNRVSMKISERTTYQYKYYKDTSDFKHFMSKESNTNLRKMTSKKGWWFLDLNINGEMHSTLLLCSGK